MNPLQEHLVTKSVRDWPVEPAHPRPAKEPRNSTTQEKEKSRERQKRTGYGHRRDRQQREQRRSPKQSEPETESGLGESDNDVNRLLNYHLTLQKEQRTQQKLDGKTDKPSDPMMFLARDTSTLHRQQKLEIVPEPPKRLSPEDARIKEINEMIRNANQEIKLDPEEMEDIDIVPLKGKTVSLGQPLSQKAPQPKKRQQKKPKVTPLSKWADEAQREENFEFDRNVHLAACMQRTNDQAVIEIKELQKMKRYKSRKDREARIVVQ